MATFVEAPDVTVPIPAVTACSGATTSNEHSGSDGGYIDFTAARNVWITWTFDLEESGIRPLSFRYALGSGGSNSRSMAFEVNGVIVDDALTFIATSSFSNWATLSFDALLKEGANTVRLIAVGESGPNIDGLSIGAAQPPDPSSVTLQAEDAVLVGAIVANNHEGATGGGFADFQNAIGDSLTWTFLVNDAGEHTVSLRYALNGTSPRTMALEVNGAVVDAEFAFAATGSWTAWSSQNLDLLLVEGTNTIRLIATGQSGPNIDRATITPAAQSGNQAPVVPDVVIETNASDPIAGGLSASDLDGDELQFSLGDKAQHGNVYLQPDGSFEYEPHFGYVGPDKFTFTVSDGTHEVTAVANVNVSSLGVPLISGALSQVNTTESGAQSYDVDTLGGGHVVVWSGYNSETGGNDVFAQRFDAQASPLGSEIILNLPDDQDNVRVAGFADGGFVVSWEETQGNPYSVYFQCFTSDGTASGDPQLVSVGHDLPPRHSISALGDDRFAIVWGHRDNNDADGVYTSDDVLMRIFDQEGNALSENITINQTTIGFQQTDASRQIDVLENGNLAVVWSHEPFFEGWGGWINEIRTRVLSPDGEPLSDESMVSHEVANDFIFDVGGNVAPLKDGGFAVVYSDDGSMIWLQRYNADGSKNGDYIPVADWVGPYWGGGYNPEVSALDDGGFVVVWGASEGVDGNYGSDSVGQRFDANGLKVGGLFLINDDLYPGAVTIELREDGALIAVWSGSQIEQKIITDFTLAPETVKDVTGGPGNDSFRGGNLDDRFLGAQGSDSIWTFSGADIISYQSPADGADSLKDFVSGQDKLEILAAGFGLTAGDRAVVETGTTASTTAASFVFDPSARQLTFDPDGSGPLAGMVLAYLPATATLTADDFVFV